MTHRLRSIAVRRISNRDWTFRVLHFSNSGRRVGYSLVQTRFRSRDTTRSSSRLLSSRWREQWSFASSNAGRWSRQISLGHIRACTAKRHRLVSSRRRWRTTSRICGVTTVRRRTIRMDLQRQNARQVCMHSHRRSMSSSLAVPHRATNASVSKEVSWATNVLIETVPQWGNCSSSPPRDRRLSCRKNSSIGAKVGRGPKPTLAGRPYCPYGANTGVIRRGDFVR